MEAASQPPQPPPAQPQPSAKRVDVGRTISETFRIYGEHAAVLLGTAAIVFIVAGLLQGLLAASGDVFLGLLGTIIILAGVTLYTGFVVKLVEDVRDGRRDFTVGELVSSAASVLGSLVANSILRAIAVGIGFLLLIVPGLILLTIWAVTAPSIVIERRGPIEAFGRSRELVKGEGWSVFGVIVVAFVITFLIGLVAGIIGAALGDAGQVVFSIIGNIIGAPISALVSAVLFFDLGGGAGVTSPAAQTPYAAEQGAPPPPPPA
jgi:hypothetical protein